MKPILFILISFIGFSLLSACEKPDADTDSTGKSITIPSDRKMPRIPVAAGGQFTLRNRTVALAKDRATLEDLKSKKPIYIYLGVQDAKPDVLNDWKKAGISFYFFMTEGNISVFYMKIDDTLWEAIASEKSIVGVAEILYADKAAPHLFEGDVPEYARPEKGRIRVTVSFYEDTSYEDAKKAMKSIGASNIPAKFGTLSNLTVDVKPKRMKDLASIPAVRFISPCCAPAAFF